MEFIVNLVTSPARPASYHLASYRGRSILPLCLIKGVGTATIAGILSGIYYLLVICYDLFFALGDIVSSSAVQVQNDTASCARVYQTRAGFLTPTHASNYLKTNGQLKLAAVFPPVDNAKYITPFLAACIISVLVSANAESAKN